MAPSDDEHPTGPQAQGMETSDVEDAAKLLDPVRGEDSPGNSKEVPVASDEAMEGTSEEYSSVQKPPNG